MKWFLEKNAGLSRDVLRERPVMSDRFSAWRDDDVR
jgi:hypothetical protein